MTNKALLPLTLSFAFALSGCDLFDDRDWREKEETAEECAQRMAGVLDNMEFFEGRQNDWIPVYTFDITKMDLDALNALIVPEDENGEGGSLRTSAFGATAPPVEAFMDLPVTEAGSFYFGEDPSLYRVRGAAMGSEDILTNGCALQQRGMRLIDIEASAAPVAQPESEDENDN